MELKVTTLKKKSDWSMILDVEHVSSSDLEDLVLALAQLAPPTGKVIINKVEGMSLVWVHWTSDALLAEYRFRLHQLRPAHGAEIVNVRHKTDEVVFDIRVD